MNGSLPRTAAARRLKKRAACLGLGLAASLRASIAGSCIVALCLAGCAGAGVPRPSAPGPGSARTPSGETPTPQAAMAQLSVGQSGRADVSAALGPAIVIPFDSGYQVWVYRWPGADASARAATELVLLFSPAGVLARQRLRPGDPPR